MSAHHLCVNVPTGSKNAITVKQSCTLSTDWSNTRTQGMVQLYLLNSFNLFQMVRYVFSTFSTSGHNTQGLCYDSNHKQVSTIHCWSYEPLQCVCLFVVRTNQDNGLKNFRVENDHAGAVSGMQICVVNHKPKLTTHFVFKTFHMLKPRHPRQQD